MLTAQQKAEETLYTAQVKAGVFGAVSANDRLGGEGDGPITCHIKGYPFEVVLPDGLAIAGAVLSDQVKSLDWRVRPAEFICSVLSDTTNKVLGELGTLLRLPPRV